MIFFITTLQQGDFRHFHFDHPELEAGLDVLNRIVAQGVVFLFRAALIDGGCVIQLPVGAFDGCCCQAAIEALEHEWHELLDNPINKKG